MRYPYVVELFCGSFGWSAGFLEEGIPCVGFDLEHCDHHGAVPEGASLVIQDVLTLHGSQFKDALVICASPPCTEYSYMAMPWSRAKKIAEDYRSGVRDLKQLTTLFDACFRIQREACEAAGRYIPMVVENVRGAQPWLGPAKARFGSMFLWGDVPALMPTGKHRKQEADPSWFYDNYENSARRFGSKSRERKAWSAQIARIPPLLSLHIARSFKPCIVNRPH